VAALEVHHPRRGVDDVGEGGAVAPRPRLSVARDRAIDEVGLDRGQGRAVAAELRSHAGHEVLDGHVGAAGEIVHDLARGGMREVQRHALLAHVHPRVVRALVVAPFLQLQMRPAHLVALARPLDLEDARAEVGEKARTVRPGEDAREVEDDEAIEEAGRGGHAPQYSGRPRALTRWEGAPTLAASLLHPKPERGP